MRKKEGFHNKPVFRLNPAYKIEKGIPIPPRTIKHMYPFEDMECGDSFAVPVILNDNPSTVVKRIRQAAYQYCVSQKLTNERFIYRYMPNEKAVRCWRIRINEENT